MNGNTRTIKRAITGFALAAALAALIVPSALAGVGNSPYGPHTGASTTHGNAASTSSQCPCNSGLPGGPRVSIPVAGSSTPVIHPRGGFGWGYAGIGAGAALGLVLVALAVGTVAGRGGTESEMKHDRNIKKRRRLARSLERAAAPERPIIGRGPRYLVQPSVAAACAPSMRALAAALRDEARPVDEESLAAVRTFITDGGSPLLGRDATAALREAVRLQHIVVGAETAVLDQEPMAVAV